MGKIFAGLIFIFFHININGFDLLPDFVGYLLIYFGMSEFGLAECRCELFWVSRGIALALAVLSALTGLLRLLGFEIEGFPAVLVGLVGMVLQLLLTYRIMRGVGELEHTFDIDLNGAGLELAWKFMIVSSLVTRCASWIEGLWGGGGTGPFGYAALLALVFAFVSMIAYVVCFYRAWKGWENRPTQPVD